MHVLPQKIGKMCIFLEKKSPKSLVIQKKVVPLHSHSEERSYLMWDYKRK